MPVKIVCETCKKEFFVDPYREKTARWCSYECMGGKKVTIVCNYCTKEFQVPASRKNTAKFCSYKCSYMYRKLITGKAHPLYKEKTKYKCKMCGRTFYALPRKNIQFCSNTCRKRYYKKNKRYKYEIIKIVCLNCNKEVFLPGNKCNKPKKFCSKKCMSEYMVKENHSQWKGGIAHGPYCEVFSDKEWREYLYKRDIDKFCWNPQCLGRGTKEHLHHINYDKGNCNPNNIIKICNSCNTTANANREWWKAFYKEVMRRRGYV